MSKKIKIGIISLTSCEGCRVSILNLGEKFLALKDKIEISTCSFLNENPDMGNFDIICIEGTAITKKEVQVLKSARERANLLIVIGNCAAKGGIQKIKNYRNKEEVINNTYKESLGIENPDIKEVEKFVKVDFVVPGCPINSEEFFNILSDLLEGKTPQIKQVPVCSQCSRVGTEKCFINQKKVCFGPWTLGGCGAPCPRGALPCYACRGFREGADLSVMKNTLEKFASEKEIENKLENFGILDDFKEKTNYENKY